MIEIEKSEFFENGSNGKSFSDVRFIKCFTIR